MMLFAAARQASGVRDLVRMVVFGTFMSGCLKPESEPADKFSCMTEDECVGSYWYQETMLTRW